MGANQSNEKSSRSQADKERRVHRKQSIHGLPTTSHRSQPADASATTVAAQAQGTTTHNLDTASLEKMLQSTSPEAIPKTNRVDRSNSRPSKPKKDIQSENKSSPGELFIPPQAPTGGIDIPATATLPTRSRHEELQDEGMSPRYEARSFVPISHHRPPRFPLPIVEVGAMPRSPNLAPVDRSDTDIIPLFDTDDQLHEPTSAGPLGRRSSMLSVATQDEEDISEELQPIGTGYTSETVPTVIEWHHPAEKVFVTGTFAAWDKKYRLKRSESNPDHWKTTINLPPGTHHLKFFVDNQMVTSPQLPTAVDFNNILVNYIEISTDDVPKSRRESSQPGPPGSKPIPTQAQPSPRPDEDRGDGYAETVTSGDEHDDAPSYLSDVSTPPEEVYEGDFRQITPQALLDIECGDEDRRYHDAAEVIRDQPHPPSLPMFLSKSILNGNLAVKDDGSVLALPNHTVLNHLMTSNVRNGVLATSVTTRYKKKYVTTISFKPVPVIEHRREVSA